MEINFYDSISDYIEGLLTPAEAALFEQQVLKDDNLKKELELQQFIHATIAKEEATKEKVAQFKQSLQPLTEAYFSAVGTIQKPAKVVSLKNWLVPIAVAASILFAVLLLFPKDGLDDYTMPESATSTRGSIGIDKAATLYKEKKYSEALPIYKAAVEKDSVDAGNRFFYALCLLKTSQYNIALPLFEQLSQGGSVYKDEAIFFTALCAFKIGDKQKARIYAAQVSEKNKNYQQAQKIAAL